MIQTLNQLPVEIILRILDLLDDFYDFRNLSHCFPVISKIINSEVHHFVIHEKLCDPAEESSAKVRFKTWLDKSILIGNLDSQSSNVKIYDINYTNSRSKAVCSFHDSFIEKDSPSLFTFYGYNSLFKETDRDYSVYYGKKNQYERTVNNEFESYIYPEFLDNHTFRELFQDIVEKSRTKKFVNIIFDTGTHSFILNMAMILKYMFLEKQKVKMTTPFSLISLRDEKPGDWFYFDGADLSQSMMSLLDYLTDIDIKFNEKFNEMVYDTFSDFSGFNRRLYINNMTRDILRQTQLDYYATNDFKAFEEILSLNNIFDKSKIKPFLQSFIESVLLKQIRKVQSKHYNNPLKIDLEPSLVNDNDYLNVFRSMDIVLLRNASKLIEEDRKNLRAVKSVVFKSPNELAQNIPKFVTFYKCVTRQSNILCDSNDMIMMDNLISREPIETQRKVLGFYSRKLREIHHLKYMLIEIAGNMPWMENRDLELRIRLFKGTNSDFQLVQKKLEKRYRYLFEELQKIQSSVCSKKDEIGSLNNESASYIFSWLDEKWKMLHELSPVKKSDQ